MATELDNRPDMELEQDIEKAEADNEEVAIECTGKPDSGEGSSAERVKHKAKRPSKSPKAVKEGNGNANAAALPLRTAKNLRRPRNGNRGLPKKGGAGGKGVWGKPGSELDLVEVDERDPNYDSDSMENGDVRLETVVPTLSEEAIQKHVEEVVLEYYEHGDTKEALLSLTEYNFGEKRHLIVVHAIEIAMDHKPSHREMTSVLLSDTLDRLLSERDMEKGYDVLLKNLPDLVLDTPDAPTVLGNFIARSVADDCLAPRYLKNYQGKVECDLAKQALVRADVLLSMKHGLVRLDNVWGVGGGLRPVQSLVSSMGLLLKEYISSGDLQEAGKCLTELEVPHFHHELVYEAVVYVLEALDEVTEDRMVQLLKFFYDSVIVTSDQMKNGFLRVIDDLDDLCLDVPSAPAVLERMASKCQAAGLLSEELLKRIPARGRKRFVSEGDGGLLKA